MNYYFEIAECLADEQGRYFAAYDVIYFGLGRHLTLLRNSERVWAENEQGAEYIKHRYADINQTQVDPKEFMWVKLRSQRV